MPVQHSPPARQTSAQARAQGVLTTTPRAPLDGTPEVLQLRACLDRGPVMQREAPLKKEERGPRSSISFSGVVGNFPGISRTTLKGPGEDDADQEKYSVEEKYSASTEVAPAPVSASQLTGGQTLAQSNRSEPFLLAIMQQMTILWPIFKLLNFLKLQDSI
ncbi:hypothetical protein O181_007083 [Austropuccinia psidii MF-1]|uniref:Uncharacterized protein n=1 Tax=Austropuccinia psidii MF-1 TaxID=1389203 RepID=A0A9Q3BLQ0_9BASI|nr:hypothetical protein [Austropuccinia psidii MF-1]